MGGKIDKDKNTQVLVTIPLEMLEQIEDYQFENRIKNRSEAIRILISKGLEKE
jgi:metal-responsive CopG/Arc/MetJ family transcriptional regulator